MERKQNELYFKEDGTNLRWITITTLLLSIGVILRMVSPSIGGISLNWNIVMYCTAIMLCRPTVKQGMGIGMVSGCIATMTSKAALPYANLVSDPLAGMVCAYLAGRYLCRIKIGKVDIEPAILVFITTFISGGSFVTITKVLLNLPMNIYLYAMLPVVFFVAMFGMVAGQLLYYPADKIFNSSSLKKAQFAMKNIKLTVPKGSFTVLTGVNGAGKSTLLMTIAGGRTNYLSNITDSRIMVGGIDVLAASRNELNKQVGMVMADYDGQLVTELVGDEIDFSLENMGMAPAEIIEKRTHVLAMVGLSGMEQRKVTSLSGGQKQRLAIASVLAADKPIIVLDEPIAAIDPEGALEIYGLLKELNEKYGKTVIVAEHDIKYISQLADQLAVIEAGELKFVGSLDDCLEYMYCERIYPEAIPLKWKIRREMRAELC